MGMTYANAIKTLGINEDISFEQLFEALLTSNAASHVKGVASECHLVNYVKRKNMQIVKVPDHDNMQRFDFLICDGQKQKTCECKMASPKGLVYISFKDARKIPMPSGKIWSTHARHISDEFDILAVNLYNITGNMKDFTFITKEKFPKYRPKNKDKFFTIGDQIRMECDFFNPSLKLKDHSGVSLDEAMLN